MQGSTFQAGKPLAVEHLYHRTDPAEFAFATTQDLGDLEEMLGQDRAVEAIRFGAEMPLQGYNLFVMGPPGTGRHSFVRQFLSRRAAGEPAAPDWCYVDNPDDHGRPIALKLPAGRGRELRQDMHRLVEEAQTAIPAVFDSEDYRSRRQAIEETFKEELSHAFEEVQERAKEQGIALIRTMSGFAFAPMRDGKVVSPDDFAALSEDERTRIQKEIEEFEKQIQAAMQAAPQKMRHARDEIHKMDREFALFAIGGMIRKLIDKYRDVDHVADYIERTGNDMVDNIALFRSDHPSKSDDAGTLNPQQGDETPVLRRYAVNLLVDNGAAQGAPVIFEEFPNYHNLVGQVEHVSRMGTLVTDFTLIKSGALHRANGGYLILDFHKVIQHVHAWEGLKQALKSRCIRMESLGQIYGLISTASLEPQPIPLDVKVVLIADRIFYYLLQAYDPEFLELFKVAADFDDRMHRTRDSADGFARLLGTLARQEGLRPLDGSAVARVLDESARIAGDAERLSTRMRDVADIVSEAHHWAGKAGQDVIAAAHVQQAIDSRERRLSRIRERLQEETLRETILIDTDGHKTGQVNGLSVMQLGDYAFGRPSRITARLRLGGGKIVDIEREVELGGPLHSKGVMILSSFLASEYAHDYPLSLAASLVFEQSYGGVEGDSASCAELYALLSVLADAPLDQGLAVTGSVNQFGQTQAIGGVNEKIEGFFDVCAARGLTGQQGVLIPMANVKHLMLRADVVEAARDGRFHIYPVATVHQGIEILTGIPAGERDGSGRFPDGTVNARVEARLIALAERRRSFAAEAKAEGQGG